MPAFFCTIYHRIVEMHINKEAIEVEKLKLSGRKFELELEYQVKRYSYSETIDRYCNVTRYNIYWHGQGRLTDLRNDDSKIFKDPQTFL